MIDQHLFIQVLKRLPALVPAFLTAALFMLSTPQVAQAQNLGEVCFAVADEQDPPGPEDQDTLTRLDRLTGNSEIIGPTGTDNIEEISFGPNQRLYGANGGQLGILDHETGAFSPLPSSAGVAGGSVGEVSLRDLDGLAYSLQDGVFFATHRRRDETQVPIGEMKPDLLVAINPTTGAHIPDFFGPGVDYVEVSVIFDDQGAPLPDVDGLAYDPVTGLLYAAINAGGRDGVLTLLETTTGVATKVATFRYAEGQGDEDGEIIDDVEGISFFNDGTLYASTGNNYDDDANDLNRLFRIDAMTGVGTLVGPFPVGPRDYEALACLTQEASIVLRKYTNGPGQLPDDADTPTGPNIPIGATVTWTYIFTNTSAISLTELILTDDQLDLIGPGGVSNCPQAGAILPPGESITCVATGVAEAGQYVNIATVTGRSQPNPFIPQQTVSDTNPSHYFGEEPGGEEPGIEITKYTNGFDANDPDGSDVPFISPGATVTWTYRVTNTGTVAFGVDEITITDDREGEITTILDMGDGDDLLEPGEAWTYVATGTALTLNGPNATPDTVPGCHPAQGEPPRRAYVNNGQVQVRDLEDTDPSHYCNPFVPGELTALGDYVWLDADRDGLQDEDETPVAGVTVWLYQSGTEAAIDSRVTNEDGFYWFGDLPLGSYFVEFTLPTGFSFTQANVQANNQDEIDSDAGVPNVPFAVSDGGIDARLGRPLTYTLSYTNSSGSDTAQGVVVSVTVPAGTTADLDASSPDWDCDASPAISGTVCNMVVGDLAAGAVGNTRFVVVLGAIDSQVPEIIEFAANLTQTTPGRTQTVEPPANGDDPTLDAGLVPGALVQNRERTGREIPPTNEEETNQPGRDLDLFLPSVQN